MSNNPNFSDLGVSAKILPVLAELGYETPTSIQEQTIPVLLQGGDLVAQAQTGTGKTAAFALPILTHLELSLVKPQALILAPTRELALQVAESFQFYAKNLPGFHVLPIYGGQDYHIQLKALKRGAHVIVGTPGRIMDHLRRKTLNMSALKTVVLDEADEMLNMGFIDDVKWILEQIPGSHQTALFSATMPASIRQVANKYLKQAQEIKITPKATNVAAITQYYMMVSRNDKLEALTRFLEVEDVDGAIIFTRTKNATVELTEKLEARGYSAAAMNGDMNQSLREQVIKRLKGKSLDIVVATEVAARGLDIDRISHVINFDIPSDVESYVHRIGRTGRAGRQGKALVFVTARERFMLRDIERATQQSIKALVPPSASQVSNKRAQTFLDKVLKTLLTEDLSRYRELVNAIASQSDYSELDIAAAIARLAQKDKPIYLQGKDIEIDQDNYEPAARRSRGRNAPPVTTVVKRKPYIRKRGGNGNDKRPDKR